MTSLQRSIELTHAVPLVLDPLQMEGAIAAGHQWVELGRVALGQSQSPGSI